MEAQHKALTKKKNKPKHHKMPASGRRQLIQGANLAGRKGKGCKMFPY